MVLAYQYGMNTIFTFKRYKAMKAQHVIFYLVILAGYLLFQPVKLEATNAGNESLRTLSEALKEAYHSATPGAVRPGKTNSDKLFLSYGFTKPEDGIQLLVARDAVVAVIDAGHPQAGFLMKHGLRVHDIQAMMNESTVSSEDVRVSLIRFLNEDLQKAADHAPLTVEGVRFVFFSEINQGGGIFDADKQIIPIDRNSNGQLDDNELFYDSPAEFARAVWLGKYPRALSVNVMLNANNADESNMDFFRWIYTEANEQLAASGLMPLNKHEQLAAIRQLEPEIQPVAETTANAGVPVWIMILLLTAGILLVGSFVVYVIFRDRSMPVEAELSSGSTFGADSFRSPGGRMYDRSHTWAFLEEDGMVKIGLDDFMQHLFGSEPKLTLMVPGKSFAKGEVMASITHLGKKVNILSPVTGKIIAINPALKGDGNHVSSDWLYRIEPENWKRELDFLYMAEPYRDWLRTEFNRLKEYLVNAVQGSAQFNAQPVMLDGGELTEGLMETAEPRVWEDFQQMFLRS